MFQLSNKYFIFLNKYLFPIFHTFYRHCGWNFLSKTFKMGNWGRRVLEYDLVFDLG